MSFLKNSVPQEFLKGSKKSRDFVINPTLQRAGINIDDTINLQLFENDNFVSSVSKIVTDVNGNFTLTLKLRDYR